MPRKMVPSKWPASAICGNYEMEMSWPQFAVANGAMRKQWRRRLQSSLQRPLTHVGRRQINARQGHPAAKLTRRSGPDGCVLKRVYVARCVGESVCG